MISRIAVESGLAADIQLDHRVLFLDPTILHIAHLLKVEALNGGIGGELYVESLRNVLLIHLLRHYSQAASTKSEGTDHPPHPIADTPIAEFDDLMNTNARGVFLGMKYEIPYLLESEQGAIINTASIGGYRAFPNIVGYGASKAAIIHMTKAAAQEYGKLRINTILPGAIDTAMLDRVKRDWHVTEEQLVEPYPIKRVGQPEEVAAMVLWLASSNASYVSGGQFSIDGGGLG